jgi:hypothetical protein
MIEVVLTIAKINCSVLSTKNVKTNPFVSNIHPTIGVAKNPKGRIIPNIDAKCVPKIY